MKSKRVIYIDVIRVVAMILVVWHMRVHLESVIQTVRYLGEDRTLSLELLK
jgi:hypothetical protein